jgi:probable rRNA maturation factor
VIDFQNDACDGVEAELFEPIFEHLACGKDIELLIVDDEKIKELNLEHRGQDKPTDVLSFPLENNFGGFIGSVVISYETAKRAADELGHGLDDEMRLLFIHGLLHLLGFDHEVDDGQMRARESEIVSLFGLPNSLIIRNDE